MISMLIGGLPGFDFDLRFREYVEHYHLERPHQGLGNCVIERVVESRPTSTTAIHVHERLGGLLTHYKRAA